MTRFDDVWFASRHPHIFSSSPSIAINDGNPDLSEFFGSMIVMDDPRHLRLRNIVSRAFTPKVVARTEVSVRDRARRLVETMISSTPTARATSVAELAGPLPLQVICDMMGIPEDDHQRMFHWTNVILGFGDKDIATDYEEFVKVSMDIGAYATALAEDRRVKPREDLTTRAGAGRGRWRAADVGRDRVVLHPAGRGGQRDHPQRDQPRRAALTRYPDERASWWADYEAMAPTAVEEIVRWASPVIYMRRTLTEDCELSGRRWRPATRRRCGTARPTVTRTSSPIRGPSTSARRPESACRFRRWRSPLLPRRQPGPP